jgi:dihydroneopterin aldolase
MIVALHGAEFFAYHGFYPEEQKLGCCFAVDIEVGFEPHHNLKDDELNHTVNYEQLYAIACEEMKLTKKLLETVAQGIIDRIKQQYTFVETVQVSVKKLNPPLKGTVKYSEVVINYTKA